MAENLWNDQQAAAYHGDLALRVYTSRLLGADPALVLHGGGNTSVKVSEPNLLGDVQDILYVKGSGWDLATIEAPGFTPIRLDHLKRLAGLESLSDLEMVNELKTQQTRASAPTGSVEAILHAVLPYKYVDHTHADALVTITNTPTGDARIREVYGDSVVVIPYVMPGFDLAREVARRFAAEANDQTVGMVLMNHGLFSFGDDARSSYERMIALVNRAEDYLRAAEAWDIPAVPPTETDGGRQLRLADLRRRVSAAAGKPMLLSSDRSDAALAFCARDDLDSISRRGPATPDHVIRTKRVPLVGEDVEGYVADYRRYFDEQSVQARGEVQMLDPAPRVILDPALGLVSVGKSAADADIVNDIYRHTIEIIQRAERLESWQALPAKDIFEVEYWELEQAKLRKGGNTPVLQGQVGLVTGAASGIGRACVDALLARGAAVVGLDLDDRVRTAFDHPGYLGLRCDVTEALEVEASLERTVERFGGLDMLILNAGLFPGGRRIAELGDQLWRQVMAVNLDANLGMLRDCYPLLKRAPTYGRVVVIGSRNVPAPGPGAAAYSASKAALNQLARVAALEWGEDRIRINTLHPDAVFDTGIWTDEVLQARADHYGMSVEQYKTKNLLGTEIRSRDVAELAAEMCGPLFAGTTAAQLPIDGGNDRVV